MRWVQVVFWRARSSLAHYRDERSAFVWRTHARTFNRAFHGVLNFYIHAHVYALSIWI